MQLKQLSPLSPELDAVLKKYLRFQIIKATDDSNEVSDSSEILDKGFFYNKIVAARANFIMAPGQVIAPAVMQLLNYYWDEEKAQHSINAKREIVYRKVLADLRVGLSRLESNAKFDLAHFGDYFNSAAAADNRTYIVQLLANFDAIVVPSDYSAYFKAKEFANFIEVAFVTKNTEALAELAHKCQMKLVSKNARLPAADLFTHARFLLMMAYLCAKESNQAQAHLSDLINLLKLSHATLAEVYPRLFELTGNIRSRYIEVEGLFQEKAEAKNELSSKLEDGYLQKLIKLININLALFAYPPVADEKVGSKYFANTDKLKGAIRFLEKLPKKSSLFADINKILLQATWAGLELIPDDIVQVGALPAKGRSTIEEKNQLKDNLIKSLPADLHQYLFAGVSAVSRRAIGLGVGN